MFKRLASVLILLVLAPQVIADFEFRIGDGAVPVTVGRGETVNLSIWGRFTTAGEVSPLVTVDGFRLALDFDGVGQGVNATVFSELCWYHGLYNRSHFGGRVLSIQC